MKKPRFSTLCISLLLLSALLAATACSTSKNTALSRRYQAFTTRYNVFYNGSEHFKEELKKMELGYEDDYTRRVLMHPAESRADNKMSQVGGSFKRTIEKMQKAIQLHSIKKKPKRRSSSPKDKEFRNREEFNPFLHNAWMMMGEAQYYNGDFSGAASTFFYISKHFKWLPDIVTEALLWQARSYCALDWNYEAENILIHIKEKQLTNKTLRYLYNFTQADYLVRSQRYEESVPYLRAAAKGSKGSQKNRLYFLLAQVYTYLGNRGEAYLAYKKAGSGSSTNYRTKFNARIKQSEVFVGADIKKEVRSLRSMTHYQRNKEYLDQIYYAIGNLYMSKKDTTEAVKNYALAIEKSTRNAIDKALAQLSLGNIYFAQHNYVKAQPLYSEAISQLNDKYPNYKTYKQRSDVLDELSTYSGNVQLQDSLLALSKLSEEEQLAVAQRLVNELKKREKEEAEAAKREEYLANQQAQGNQNQNQTNAPTQYQINGDKSWYFYNTMTKNAGKTEFQKRWGARRNEDDWRRRNKNTFSFDEIEGADNDTADNYVADTNTDSIAADSVAVSHESDPHFAEFYLKQIPKTDVEIQTCHDIIQEGLYNMGVILKDKLEDYAAARTEFARLITAYPDNIYRLDTYYNCYLMEIREGNADQAEHYRQLIITEFADSDYGNAMKDPSYFDNLKRMNILQESMYQETYNAYLNNDNETVHRLTAEMERDYPLSKILPKFVFIDALSYVTEKNENKFKDRLTELLQKWPETDMTPMASNMLKGISQGRKLQSDGSNSRGMLWNIRLTADTTLNAKGEPASFVYDPAKPHLFVMAFSLDSVNENKLLYDVARHNFSSFEVRDFDLEQMRFGSVGLLIVKTFNNSTEVEQYRTLLENDDDFQMPDGVRPILISVDNFEILLREGRSLEEYFKFETNARVESTEQSVVGKDNTMPTPANDENSSDDKQNEQPAPAENDTTPEPTEQN